MAECKINTEFASSSNQFHFEPELAPVYDAGDKGKLIIYKVHDETIESNPEGLCAIQSILNGNAASQLMYLNYPCNRCQRRIFIRPAPSEQNKKK